MLLATTVLVLPVGCGGEATAPPASSQERPTPSFASPNEQMDSSVVESYARENYPDVFAGVAAEEGGTIAVYRVPPAADFDSALIEEFGAGRFVLRDAARSEQELDTLTQLVLEDSDYWRSHGVRIDGAGPDFIRGVVEVLTPDADTAGRLLPERYGTSVTVREGTVSPASSSS